jgi:hypothetical protein
MDKTKKIIGISIIVIVISAIILIVLEISNDRMMINNAGNGLSESSMLSDMVGFTNESKMVNSAVSPRMTDTVITPEVSDNKIIKTGSLNLKVSSADSAAEKIAQIAIDNGGEVFSSNFSQSSKNIKSGSIRIKVPVNNFEKTFAEMKTVATLVMRESTSGTDVTMEYVDLQIQIKNKQAEEQSFVNILDRAGKIEDVLAVTREISRVRSEIESLQGRIKFLESQTDKSSIDVFLIEDENITFTDSWRPWQVVKETFNALLKDIQNCINFAIVLVFRIIPTVILYILIFGLLYWLGKKIYFKIKN